MAWPCARAQCGSGEPRIVMWVALWDARVSGRAMSAREVALDAKGARRSRRRSRLGPFCLTECANAPPFVHKFAFSLNVTTFV